MLVIWRGYGYVALAAAILPLAACAGLFDFGISLGLLGFGVGTLVAGVICLVVNRSLRRAAARREAAARGRRDPDNPLRAGGTAEGETTHTLYFIPLWVWGWAYCILGLFFGGTTIVGIILKGWRK